MNKLNVKHLGLILITVVMLAACTLTVTPPAVPLATDVSSAVSTPKHLPFEGTWVTDGDMPEVLVFTRNSMYRVQSDQASGTESYSREQFADVISYDLTNNHVSLRTQWIRLNGTLRGFDAPNFNITYEVEGDTLQIGIGWDDEFVTELEPLVYHRK